MKVSRSRPTLVPRLEAKGTLVTSEQHCVVTKHATIKKWQTRGVERLPLREQTETVREKKIGSKNQKKLKRSHQSTEKR